MTLEQRLARAVRHVGDGVVVPAVDPDAVRARARTNRRRTAALVVAAAVVAVGVAAAASTVAGRDASSPLPPAGPISPSETQSPSTGLPPETGPRTWEAYSSTRYDFSVGHPRDWTEWPASRDWAWDPDIQESVTSGHEAFLSPDGHVRVSAWNAPLDPGTRPDSIRSLVGWVEDYCLESGNSPCTGIAERAVDLCLEARDCHPGVLVPFDTDVQAFFTGGIYAQDAMTVVAVWRRDSSPHTADYGGSQRLLEAFLSTMDVWPRSTPISERR